MIKVGNVPLLVNTLQPNPQSIHLKSMVAPAIKTSSAFVKIQAATRRSWEEAVKQLGRPREESHSPIR